MAAKQLTRSGEDQKPQPPSKWLSPNYVAVLLLVGIIGLVVSLCYVAGPCSTHHKTSSGEVSSLNTSAPVYLPVQVVCVDRFHRTTLMMAGWEVGREGGVYRQIISSIIMMHLPH